MEHTDYYKVLEVERSATAQQIKDAYRHLAFKYHPDRNQDHAENAEKMKSVNEAYAVLSNADKRREYDSLRDRFGASSAHGRFRQSYTDQDIFNGSDIHHIFEEVARSFGLRGVNDIFRDFYGPGFRSFQVNRPGMRGRGYFFTTGGPRRGSSPFLKKGRGGNGGAIGRLSRFMLKQFAGAQFPQKGGDLYDRIVIDPLFAAKGGPYAYFHRRRSKRIVITIPKGLKEGRKIRLAGLGEMGRGGAEPGDLYIQIVHKRSLAQTLKRLFISFFNRVSPQKR